MMQRSMHLNPTVTLLKLKRYTLCCSSIYSNTADPLNSEAAFRV